MRAEFLKWLAGMRQTPDWSWLPPVDKLAVLDGGSYANPIVELAWRSWVSSAFSFRKQALAVKSEAEE